MIINNNYLDEIEKILENKNELEDFKRYCTLPLKKSIKINLHKINLDKFRKLISNWWWKIIDPWFIEKWNIENDSFYIDREEIDFALWKSFLHMSGIFYIQEIAAGMPARFLDIKEWDKILDISSAPWWKSTQIWDYLLSYKNRPWIVVANDVNWKRLQTTAHNLNRMWIYNSMLTKLNWFVFGKNLWEVFDHVLVDAPCSGEWTWFKSDFSLKIWKRQEINKICGTQFQLLVSAIKSCKQWWTIVYSTCTMNPYENEENVSKILDFFKWAIELENVDIKNKSIWITEIEIDNETKQILSEQDAEKLARFWPHKQKTWWFFIAKFKKVKTLQEKYPNKENKIAPKNPFKIDTSKSLQKQVSNFIQEQYWIKVDKSKYLFFATSKKIYLTSPEFLEFKDILEFEKVWVPIMKFGWEHKFIPLHSFGTTIWWETNKKYINLNQDDMQKYSNLEDIKIENLDWKYKDREYVVIKFEWIWMWVGKIIDGKIKNKFIKA